MKKFLKSGILFFAGICCFLLLLVGMNFSAFSHEYVRAEEVSLRKVVLEFDSNHLQVEQINFTSEGEDVQYLKDEVTSNEFYIDNGTKFYVKFALVDEAMINSHYVKTLSFKAGGIDSFTQIDQAVLDDDRKGVFSASYVPGVGYSRTVNNAYTFNYDYLNEGLGFELTVVALTSDMTLNFGVSQKFMGVTFSGPGASMGASSLEQINYGDDVQIVLTPTETEIFEQVDFYFGSTKLISIFGGMVTGDDYFFKDGQTHDKILAYGNYAFGYESDLNFVKDSSTLGNFAKIWVEEQSSDIESFSITIDDKGVITFSSSKVSRWLNVNITAMKYAQVDLKESSDAFSSVTVGDKTYTEEIPNRIFALDFGENIFVSATVKSGYNFDGMDASFIEGGVYENTSFGGGLLEIKAIMTDAVIFRLDLVKDGKSFKDSATKIFVSTQDGVDSVADFSSSELALTSSLGYAEVSGIASSTKLKIYVQISPYYQMAVGAETFAYSYANFDYEITQNQNLVIDVSLLNFVRPVFFDDEIIGEISIQLHNIQVVGTAYNATFVTGFRGNDAENFTTITSLNPSKYGFFFQNFVVKDGSGNIIGDNFIQKVVGVTDAFNIPLSDTDIHEFISQVVFYATGESLKLEVEFVEKLKTFRVHYNDSYIVGYAYFGANEIYLRSVVNVETIGMYFAGLRYDNGTDAFEFTTVEDAVIEESNFQGGTFKYLLSTPWNMDIDNAVLEVFTDYRTFKPVFVMARGDGEPVLLEYSVKYGQDLNIFIVNSGNIGEPTIGPGYNLIGWKVNGEGNYIIYDDDPSDEQDFLYGETIEYLWVENVRFVPVFSRGLAIVTIYDENQQYLNSTTIKYGSEADVSAILVGKDGNFIVPQVFGYNLIGFYDAVTGGEKVVSYKTNPVYEFNTACSYFEDLNGKIVWSPPVDEDGTVQNFNLYARFNAITYSMTVNLEGAEYRAGSSDVYVQNANVLKLDDNTFYANGFDITDTLVVSSIRARTDAFISLVNITIKDIEGTDVLSLVVSSASSNRNGEIQNVVGSSFFDYETSILTLPVADFINSTTNGMSIELDIVYLPVTYIISFTAVIQNEAGESLNPETSEPVFYKVDKANAQISKVDNWLVSSELGGDTGMTGWITLELPDAGVSFPVQSLYGISGIFFNYQGVTYSFKNWKAVNDEDEEVNLEPSTSLTFGYDFYAVFTDEADVNVDYHIYNDVSKSYELISHDGYFWSYDPIEEKYFMNSDILTANTYEIYLINGELYHVTSWITEKQTNLAVGVQGGFAPNVKYDIDYSAEVLTINFYAVYSKFFFDVNLSSDVYEATVSVPNDANGNSYSAEDVAWVLVDKGTFDAFSSLNYSVADKLSQILFTSQDTFSLATIKTGASVEASVVNSNNQGGVKYLFVVLQRQLDGKKVNSCYYALQVPIS